MAASKEPEKYPLPETGGASQNDIVSLCDDDALAGIDYVCPRRVTEFETRVWSERDHKMYVHPHNNWDHLRTRARRGGYKVLICCECQEKWRVHGALHSRKNIVDPEQGKYPIFGQDEVVNVNRVTKRQYTTM